MESYEIEILDDENLSHLNLFAAWLTANALTHPRLTKAADEVMRFARVQRFRRDLFDSLATQDGP